MKTSYLILAVTLFFLVGITVSMAQTPPGIPEINEGKSLMAQNFRALSSAIRVLGALFGLMGGLRIYNNWQMGRRNIDMEVAGWFGACIFLSVLGIFLSALFQVPIS
ncbi:DUF4134 domain-containing protein [Cyclobacterium plantarum]|uniref:DUF4134 domain-containing protein n=1 Tax=Cyclobacterium plantarum TaxID=2716263 RepID=A0ABX0H7Q1_9BACT|nr:DUF4134 domain-containing protein [Cyclobacterium plantarum]NHE56447.1 DUF4134 domain-containing protein [Cyclobacterium plantarum]